MPQALLKQLESLRERRAIADIDLHFGCFMARLDGAGGPEVLLGACLASHWVGTGHVCVDLPAVAGRPLLDLSGPEVPVLPGLERWVDALRQSPVVGHPGDYRPLVLDDAARLYLYRYWDYERQVAAELLARAGDAPEVDLGLLKDGLERWFPPGRETETNWQKAAAAMAVLRRVCVISGGPGTGKTTTVLRILCLLIEQAAPHAPLRIALAAPTGKAAARLFETLRAAERGLRLTPAVQAALPGEATTLHRLLGIRPDAAGIRHDRDLPLDVLVVDEASMVDLALMAKLLGALPRGTRLILLGDKDQLASVEAGAVLGDICGPAAGSSPAFQERAAALTGEVIAEGDPEGGPLQESIVLLKRNFRFGEKSGIGRLARCIAAGRVREGLELLRTGKADLTWQPLAPSELLRSTAIARIEAGFSAYLGLVRSGADPKAVLLAFNQFRILCAHRSGPTGVDTVNEVILAALVRSGLVAARRSWYAGRPVMVNRNHYGLKLFNGDVGTALPDAEAGHELRVFFEAPDGTLRRFSAARLPEHETVFAMTVHKSQGTELDRVMLLLPDTVSPILTRELIYTAITRARTHVEIWGTETVLAEAIQRSSARSSGLREALWGAR